MDDLSSEYERARRAIREDLADLSAHIDKSFARVATNEDVILAAAVMVVVVVLGVVAVLAFV